MNKTFRIAVSLMAVWLVACIILSWASILDDALIHLRFADHLLHTHQITYDGVHPNYGVSSLLYVSLLAFLRSFIASPNLPRAVSSIMHLILFSGMAILLWRSNRSRSSLVQLLSLILLLLLVVPSAVRWLDDGMETSLVLCVTSLLCWCTFRESSWPTFTAMRYAGLVVLGFLTVMLRIELAMLCGIAFAILTLRKVEASADRPGTFQTWLRAALHSSHLLVGNLLGMATVLMWMHVLLPDTAVAKSHGIAMWRGVLSAAGHALAGGFSFSMGMLLLWLLTFAFLLRVRRASPTLLLANAVFPLTLLLAVLRGQEIQGIRYLQWTLLFSVLWNLLELGAEPLPDRHGQRQGSMDRNLTYALLAVILLAQPLEAAKIYPVLAGRARLMRMIPSQHLDVLQGKLGVAADVGIIGYFSKANICDLSGLIDGREFARLSPEQRETACAASSPDFLYLDDYELGSFNTFMPVAGWQVCGEYEVTALHNKDIHYLILPPSTAKRICSETSGAEPYPASRILALSSPLPALQP